MGLTYARIALPIILVMAMNGTLTIADALFLGYYVGPEALAAVTLMFPIYMLIVSLATLVSSGMSSLLARQLGGNQLLEARSTFASAHGLALLVAGVFVVLFFHWGRVLSTMAAAGSEEIAELGFVYLRITVLTSPLLFILTINSDALRNEGRVRFMAGMSLVVSATNIAFNYLLIAQCNLGVAGSAYGTALAQILALSIIVTYRMSGSSVLPFTCSILDRSMRPWKDILALGAPQSLNFVGFSLGSGVIIAALQMVQAENYDHTVAAYGIITRILTFAYMPLLGLSYAMQTITGNNFGAAHLKRSNGSLRFALLASLLYCAAIQSIVMLFPARLAGYFVEDPITISEVGRILPVMSVFFAITGPLMMVAMHFQAIGDARRAGVLGLAKPYFFAIPLTTLLSWGFGEAGIWFAGPIAELCLLALTAFVLLQLAQNSSLRWGLFETSAE